MRHSIKACLYSLMVLATVFVAGCVGTRATNTSQCSSASLKDIEQDPIRFAGTTYCGPAFIRRFDRSTVIVSRPDKEPNLDLIMIVTRDRGLLADVTNTPRKYEIRATVDVMRECFVAANDPDPSRRCIPFRRPIDFYVTSASPSL
jgi:hypothetical protein